MGEFDRVVWSHTYNPPISETHRRYGYLGGVEFTSGRNRSVSGFVHALAGVAQFHTTLRGSLPLELSDSEFAIQFGGMTPYVPTVVSATPDLVVMSVTPGNAPYPGRGPGAAANGPRHHYVFELYALDTMIEVEPTGDAFETRANVFTAMQGHVVAKAVYGGLFRRPQ